MKLENLIGIEEVAKILHLTVGSVYQAIHNGRIPCYKVGKRVLFDKEEIQVLIEKGRIDHKER